MRIRALVLGAAALVALTSGCGDRGAPGHAAPADGEGVLGSGQDLDLDKVDACALVTDDELRAFFGEPAGKKEPKPFGYIRGCALDDASGTSYVFVSVQHPPIGHKEQFDFDRSQTTKPVAVTGVGEEAFGWYDEDDAEVETRHRGALVIVSIVLYAANGVGRLDDPPAVFDRLTLLTKQALARL
jgi:hypothetical protein